MPKQFDRKIGGVKYVRLYEDQEQFLSSINERTGGKLADIVRKFFDFGMLEEARKQGFNSVNDYLNYIREAV